MTTREDQPQPIVRDVVVVLTDGLACIAVESLDPEEGTVRQWVFAARAEVELARGAIERAAEVAEQGLALGYDPELGQVIPRLRATRSLALAEAARGDVEGAAARVEAAILEATLLASPPLASMLPDRCARLWTPSISRSHGAFWPP